jgi:hypothetical protein
METERNTMASLPWQSFVLASILGVLGLSAGSSRQGSSRQGSPASAPPHDASGTALDTVVSFSEDVLPIFRERCSACHGGEDENGDVITESYLDLLTYEGAMAGSEYGTVIEPGDPDASILVDMITEGDMPEEGDPVPPEEIEIIRTWIAQGAEDN